MLNCDVCGKEGASEYKIEAKDHAFVNIPLCEGCGDLLVKRLMAVVHTGIMELRFLR